jgi:hypothetical protein
MPDLSRTPWVVGLGDWVSPNRRGYAIYTWDFERKVVDLGADEGLALLVADLHNQRLAAEVREQLAA